MSSHESMRSEMREFTTEMRKLRDDVVLASVETKTAAHSMKETKEGLQEWTLSLQKRVEKLEKWQSKLIGAGVVAGALLWDKAKKIMGLS